MYRLPKAPYKDPDVLFIIELLCVQLSRYNISTFTEGKDHDVYLKATWRHGGQISVNVDPD